ncbi:PQQ-binding-like beta-propeller repeat protein [Streptomyces sp. Mo3]|uniref:outer membrane protein assembly factor BamB family protein n=1 Tax=Streptomyces sp. Mo3 TaxID=3161190 RepID=UPI0039EF7CB1
MGEFAPLEAGDPERVGRYRIVARLGRGGMGRVYLGRSPGGRAVAVKVVRPELAEDPDFRRRFDREVKAARRVTGFFTAAVVDAEPEAMPPWLATEYVPGMSLDAAVDAHGAWPEPSALALGAALAEALEAVHGADVVHRDLKPSNVLLAANGPRLIDFGISLAAEATKLTETGATIGTPGFMSPEQLAGDTVGAASDVFALGAVLAYAATGSGPFGGGPAHALNYRVVHEEPDLTGLPPRLADVVARCLAKDPGQRPTVPDLVAELSRAAQAEAADGSSTRVGWLPEPVTTEITRRQAEPLVAPTGQATVEDVPPTVRATAPVPGPPEAPGSGGERRWRRWFTRGPVLAGLAVAVVLAVVVTVTLLPDHGSGGEQSGKQSGKQTGKKPPAPVLKQLWSYSQGTKSPPSVEGGRVYFGEDDGGVSALDADTGDRVWEFGRTMGDEGSPVFAEGAVYFSSRDDGFDQDRSRVYALDAATGRHRWEFEPNGWVDAGPVVVGGTAYFSSSKLGGDGILYAVDAATGEKEWSQVLGRGAGLAYDDGVVYYGARTVRGSHLYALDADTGKQVWKVHISADVLPSAITSLTVADGVIHTVGDDGVLSARDADNGDLLWKYRTDLSDFLGSSPPVVVDGAVYISGNTERDAGDGQVFAVNAKTGALRWKYRMPRVSSPPTVTAGTVYVSTEAGALELLSADSGDSSGQVRLADDHEPNVTVVDGVAYFDGGDGRLHAATVTR